MDIQILNIAELLLFVFMICICIRIYRQKKQKGKISLKTLIMFLINLIFYAMVLELIIIELTRERVNFRQGLHIIMYVYLFIVLSFV